MFLVDCLAQLVQLVLLAECGLPLDVCSVACTLLVQAYLRISVLLIAKIDESSPLNWLLSPLRQVFVRPLDVLLELFPPRRPEEVLRAWLVVEVDALLSRLISKSLPASLFLSNLLDGVARALLQTLLLQRRYRHRREQVLCER